MSHAGLLADCCRTSVNTVQDAQDKLFCRDKTDPACIWLIVSEDHEPEHCHCYHKKLIAACALQLSKDSIYVQQVHFAAVDVDRMCRQAHLTQHTGSSPDVLQWVFTSAHSRACLIPVQQLCSSKTLHREHDMLFGAFVRPCNALVLHVPSREAAPLGDCVNHVRQPGGN